MTLFPNWKKYSSYENGDDDLIIITRKTAKIGFEAISYMQRDPSYFLNNHVLDEARNELYSVIQEEIYDNPA